jgi:hypothetical protein
VKAVVINVDKSSKHVKLSLKPSHFVDGEERDSSDEEPSAMSDDDNEDGGATRTTSGVAASKSVHKDLVNHRVVDEDAEMESVDGDDEIEQRGQHANGNGAKADKQGRRVFGEFFFFFLVWFVFIF